MSFWPSWPSPSSFSCCCWGMLSLTLLTCHWFQGSQKWGCDGWVEGEWDWSSGLGRTKPGVAWIGIDTCLMISNSQLMSAEGSTRIAVVCHCSHVTFHFMTSQTYDSNFGPNCSCKSTIIGIKKTIFLFCSNGCYSLSILALLLWDNKIAQRKYCTKISGCQNNKVNMVPFFLCSDLSFSLISEKRKSFLGCPLQLHNSCLDFERTNN